ncbi:hypothetical protein K470DRAFT_275896 [Piedraia hortae CBS 480.64]|uniref:Uncharacterized protein n=1 Tax=Piedraia hortae CBS 480.64 TaxID=1314780 RepID=A0A6A7C4U6_9PEZI|nr:hypothetical protein K470DRAFT_275896 [Piedraia hortae CBS 480.64]
MLFNANAICLGLALFHGPSLSTAINQAASATSLTPLTFRTLTTVIVPSTMTTSMATEAALESSAAMTKLVRRDPKNTPEERKARKEKIKEIMKMTGRPSPPPFTFNVVKAIRGKIRYNKAKKAWIREKLMELGETA